MAAQQVPPANRPIPDPTELTTAIVNEAKVDLRREMGQIEKAIRELFDQKFKAIDQRFGDNSKAVDAALQAAEKAVGKSESGFTKQIDEMGRTTGAVTDGINKAVEDLKSRVGLIEGRSMGSTESKTDNRGFVSIAIAAAAVVVTLVIAFVLRPH
jgi:hypothetical protein